jgi:sugar lactone lactonase YvrE
MRRLEFGIALVVCGLWIAMPALAGTTPVMQETAADAVEAAQEDVVDSTESDDQEESTKAAADDDGMTESFEATHQETDALKPSIEGIQLLLHTFELDSDGNVWACVSDANRSSKRGRKASKEPVESAEDSSEGETAKGYVLVYGPDKSLLRKIAVPFAPSAIDLDPSGTVYLAGEGRICKMTNAGKILQMTGTPNLDGKDIEQVKKDALEEYKKQMASSQENLAKQKARLEEKIAAIEETPEEDRTKRQTAQLEAFQQQLEQLASVSPSEEIDPQLADYLIESKFRVPSLCATPQYVFVTTGARSGFAYAIWRVDANLENPKELIPQVSGCCGQMDVEADDEHLFVADNTKFCVSIYDVEGEKIDKFGRRGAKNDNGFGSCCNPMNVCCASNGDLLTAESSIGKIKRFNADGKMIGYVGRAKIGAGCKHVALGYDQARDRYYIQYQDKNQICILVPNSEAADLIAERKARMTEMMDACKPLLGRWTQATDDSADDESDRANANGSDEDDAEESDVIGAIDISKLASQIEQIEFAESGQLKLKTSSRGSLLAHYRDLKWVPMDVESDGSLVLGLEHQEMQMFSLRAKLESDDKAQISVTFDGAGDTPVFVSFERAADDE